MRELAWRRTGQVAQGDTITEMAINNGMDFEYKLVPHFFEVEQGDDVFHVQEPSRLLTVGGTRSLHSVVASDFQFFQPLELAGVMDEILHASKDWNVTWKPESALVFAKGATTCYIINMGPATVGNTRCNDYLTVTDTVDGKHSLQAAITRARIWCANMLRSTMRRATVKLNVRHSRGHRDIFKANVENIMHSQGQVHEAMQALAARDVSEKAFSEYLDKLFAIPEREEDRTPSIVKKMGQLKMSAQGNFYRMIDQELETPNAFVAANAAQETIEHSGLLGNVDVVARSLLTGKGNTVEWITRAFELAEAL